ncbi:MAG: hypothetical protein HGB14_04805 [Anaerolineaceae bacterium]|nr:hypothetical protein [Anaerolineaceae bacterium]
MRRFLRKKGAALITVVALIVVTSAIVATVYYFIRKGVEVSGLQKKYQTAREASLGGLDVFTKEILPMAISGTNLSDVVTSFSTITSAQVFGESSNACFRFKLRLPGVTDPGGCNTTMNAKDNPDVRFVVSGIAPARPFVVYTKIIDSVAGNSSTSGITLEGQGTAESQSGIITAQHFPYMYRMEVQSERQNDATEKANFTVLYAY